MVDLIAGIAEDGAVVIGGNHHEAGADGTMHDAAADAARWSHAQLTPASREFLSSLPLMTQDEDRLYVHGDGSAPAKDRDVTDALTALRSLEGCDSRIVVSGHVHVPAL
jgi:predicted phosphodiesterase